MPQKLIKLLLVVRIPVLLLFLFLLSFHITNFNKEPSALSRVLLPLKHLESEVTHKSSNKVQQLLNDSSSLPGKYSIYIKDLKTGQTYTLNAQNPSPAASIYKIAIMYATYDQIQQGKLKKETILSTAKSKIESTLSPASPEASPVPQSTEFYSSSVEDALNSMISVSDNYSAILLAEKIGWANIEKFLKIQEIYNFHLATGQPQASAESVGKLLEKIYKKEAVSPKYSQEMINLLLSQTVNDRIPANLNPEVKVAHKTGELDNIRNDAGIIFGKKGDYIMVIMSETPVPNDAVENIASLSNKIYEELEQ